MLSDVALRAYHRQFQAIATYLIKEHELAESDRDRHYWFGLHPHTRVAIEQHLAITIPNHPRAKPYTILDVYKAGCYVFDANAFDLNLPQQTTPLQGYTTGQCHLTESRVVQTSVPLPPQSQPPKAEDLGNLVCCLASLRVNDLDYATTYAELVVTYPQLVGVIAKPTAFTGTSVVPPSPSTQPQAALGLQICGFCHDPGCTARSTRFCPIGQSYVQANKVIQVDGWYRWPDNSWIDTHPQGIKFVVDRTLEDRAKQHPEAANPMPHHSLFFEVTPAPTLQEPPTSAYIEEVATEDDVTRTYHTYQMALAAQKDCLDGSVQPVRGDPKPEQDKKLGQFHYKAKC